MILKIFLLPCFCLIAGVAHGQDTVNHFHLENGNIVWQMRLDSASVPADYMGRLKSKNIFERAEGQGGQISGDLRGMAVLYREAGYTMVGTPFVLLTHTVKGYGSVDMRAGSYVITVRKILLAKPMGKGEKRTPLERSETTKGQFDLSFRKDDSKILNKTFEGLFGQ